MFKKIALVVVGLIVALLAYAATRPDALHVQRAASVKAPPEEIFPLISDLHRWTSWSPYEKRDPAMKRTYSGAAQGKGAATNGRATAGGQGRMEITDTRIRRGHDQAGIHNPSKAITSPSSPGPQGGTRP